MSAAYRLRILLQTLAHIGQRGACFVRVCDCFSDWRKLLLHSALQRFHLSSELQHCARCNYLGNCCCCHDASAWRTSSLIDTPEAAARRRSASYCASVTHAATLREPAARPVGSTVRGRPALVTVLRIFGQNITLVISQRELPPGAATICETMPPAMPPASAR